MILWDGTFKVKPRLRFVCVDEYSTQASILHGQNLYWFIILASSTPILCLISSYPYQILLISLSFLLVPSSTCSYTLLIPSFSPSHLCLILISLSCPAQLLISSSETQRLRTQRLKNAEIQNQIVIVQEKCKVQTLWSKKFRVRNAE